MMSKMTRIWLGSAGIAIVVSLASLAFSQAQVDLQPMNPLRPPVDVTSAPTYLAANTTSDANAVEALQKVVEASGGMHAWRQIRSSKVRLSVSFRGGTKEHEFLMLDDWTTDDARYRRGAIGSKKAPHDHNGQATFRTEDNGKDHAVPEFDQARVLAGSLPAAAAEIILRKSSYIAKQEAGPRCSENTICVDIYRQSSPKAPLVREEEWLISKASGLPTTIDLLLPNLNGVRAIWEEFTFDQMTNQNGLVIPSKIEMRHPSGVTLIRNVESFTPNVRFDTAAFDKEIGR